MDKNVFLAMVWRDYKSFVRNRRQFLLYIILSLSLMLIMVVFLLRSSSQNVEQGTAWINRLSLLAGVNGGYLALLIMLRFWQVKVQGTLISLAILPSSFRLILLAKCITPVLVSVATAVLYFISIHAIAYFLTDLFVLNLITLFHLVIVVFVVGLSFAIINGYSMWCLNVVYSKIMQICSSLLYAGIFGFVLAGGTIPVAIILLCCALFLGLATISFFSTSKEKVMKHLYE